MNFFINLSNNQIDINRAYLDVLSNYSKAHWKCIHHPRCVGNPKWLQFGKGVSDITTTYVMKEHREIRRESKSRSEANLEESSGIKSLSFYFVLHTLRAD